VEVFDPRTVYPFDWTALAASVAKTGRLVAVDDSNRSCGIGAEVLATAAEKMRLVAPPKRVSRPDGAVLPFAVALDRALQPSPEQDLESEPIVHLHAPEQRTRIRSKDSTPTAGRRWWPAPGGPGSLRWICRWRPGPARSRYRRSRTATAAAPTGSRCGTAATP